MQITNIKIKNFAGVADTDIDASKVLAFLGPCGTGKTSRMQAIRFLLFGEEERNIIRNGCNFAEVSITLSDGSVVEKKRTRSSTIARVNGVKTTVKSMREYLEGKLGASLDIMRVICNQNNFESFNKKEMTQFFLSVLPARVDVLSLPGMLEFVAGYPLTDDELEFVTSRFADIDEISLQDIEEARNYFMNERKEQKHVCQILQNRLPETEPAPPAETKQELEEQLYRIAQKEAARQNQEKERAAYERAMQVRNAALSKMSTLQAALKEYAGVEMPDPEVEKKTNDERELFRMSILKHSQTQSVLRNNIALFKRTLESLDQPVCPLSNKLVCTTDKTAIRKELEDAVAQNEAEIAKHDEHCKKCNEQIAKRDQELIEIREARLRYEKKVSLEKQISVLVVPEEPERPAWMKECSVEEKLAHTSFSALPDIFDITGDVRDFKDAIVDEKTSIHQKMAAIDAYTSYINTKKVYDEEKQKLDLLELAVLAFDPKKGIGQIILDRAAGTITDLCNERAEKLDIPFTVSISCTEGVQIFVAPNSSAEMVPYEDLSTGESLIAFYLIISAISRVANSRILMVDSCDKLDKELLRTFLNVVIQDDAFDTVFIGGVDHDDTMSVMGEFDQVSVTTLSR